MCLPQQGTFHIFCVFFCSVLIRLRRAGDGFWEAVSHFCAPIRALQYFNQNAARAELFVYELFIFIVKEKGIRSIFPQALSLRSDSILYVAVLSTTVNTFSVTLWKVFSAFSAPFSSTSKPFPEGAVPQTDDCFLWHYRTSEMLNLLLPVLLTACPVPDSGLSHLHGQHGEPSYTWNLAQCTLIT